MNKIIFLIALIGISLAADAASPTCDKTAKTNINVSGVCQWGSPYVTEYETTGAVKTCKDTTANATNADCTCKAGTNSLWGKTESDAKCADPKATDPAWCPVGHGLFTNSTGSLISCVACTGGCKTCPSSGASADAAKCDTCYDSGAAKSGTTCPAGTKNKLFIKYVGWFEKCPAGYVAKAAGGECVQCGVGCALCTEAAPADCTACADGHIIKDKKCVVVDATNKCDDKCKTCQTLATTCTTCADKHEFTAAGVCSPVAALELCKEVDSAKTTECKTCMDNADLVTDKTKCACKPTHWFQKVTFDGTKDPVVAFKYECTKCTKDCAAGQRCKADGSDCEADPNATTTAAATVATSDQPGAACTDSTLKASGCVKCADATKCETCFAGQAFNATEKVCLCSAGADTAAWDAPTMKCVNCPAKCTDATNKYCNIKTAGTATTAAVAECTGTAPAAAAKAVGDAAAAAATGNDSNGILISAISMILAVILA